VMTFTHLDGLAVGSSLAVCLRDAQLSARVRRMMPLAAAGAFAGIVSARLFDGEYFFWGKAMASFGYSCIAVLFGTLLVYALGGGRALGLDRFLTSRFMTKTGKYSYALYMVHVPILTAAESAITPTLAPRLGAAPTFAILALAAFGVSWLTAVLSWH